MSQKEFTVSRIVGELVKNSVDAQCNVVKVEFNGSFDFRVIDDGCGFHQQVLEDIGERQLFLVQSLQKRRFRYGKHGKFLLDVAQSPTAEIFIESIRQNSDVRLYKSVIANKSLCKIYKTDRSDKDGLVSTGQGSMVVLNTLNLNIDDADRQISHLVNTVVDLSLVNFEVDISVRNTATQETLYTSHKTKNLFEKFEQFLESRQFFSKIQSVACEKHKVKVELLFCEDATSSKTFQFVYFNKLIESNGKWRKFINKLCRKRFANDLNSTCPVYLMNIFAENYDANHLTYNVIIDKCIRKCVEQLSQAPADKTSVSKKSASKVVLPIADVASPSKDVPVVSGNEPKGVGLGDYIFNNSCENYEQLNLGRDVYRKKICENWIISLDKPKPKDLANDSLQSVAIDRSVTIREDDHLFKKPKPMAVKSKTSSHTIATKMKPTPQTSTHTYQPSQHVRVFNNSSLLRTSKKLIAKTSTGSYRKVSARKLVAEISTDIRPKRKDSTKNRNENRFELKEPVVDVDNKHNNRKPSSDLNPMPTSQMDVLPDDPFENLNDRSNGPNLELSDVFNSPHDAFKAPLYFSSTQKTLDFRWNQQTTNFNMNFSSSIAIHTMNDDDAFLGNFLGNDVRDNNSMKNVFESIEQPANDISTRSQLKGQTNRANTQPETYQTSAQLQTDSNRWASTNEMHRSMTQTPVETNRPRSSSVYSQRSEFRYRHHRNNNSVRTHYRSQTCRSFVSDNSLDSHYSGRKRDGRDKTSRPKSIKSAQSSTQSATTTPATTSTAVTPLPKRSSLVSDDGLKTGWPVTININFGGQPQ